MRLKKASIIFILILIIILVFIIGVRYGQRVEKTNKIVNYLISLPPKPTAQPTLKPLEFQTYVNKYCALQFLYPNSLKKDLDSSTSAILSRDGQEQIELYCIKNQSIIDILDDKDLVTEEITFKGKKIQAKSVSQDKGYVLRFIHPKNAKTIYVTILKSLYPLFEKSLEFTP